MPSLGRTAKFRGRLPRTCATPHRSSVTPCDSRRPLGTLTRRPGRGSLFRLQRCPSSRCRCQNSAGLNEDGAPAADSPHIGGARSLTRHNHRRRHPGLLRGSRQPTGQAARAALRPTAQTRSRAGFSRRRRGREKPLSSESDRGSLPGSTNPKSRATRNFACAATTTLDLPEMQHLASGESRG
jgi:hypothetical protein